MKKFFLILAGILAGAMMLVLMTSVLVTSLVSFEQDVRVARPGILVVELDGPVVERMPDQLFQAELLGIRHQLLDLVLALDRAATDDRIAGVYLRVGPPGFGWAKAEEIRERLSDFRDSGKFVYAYTSFTDELGYYVAMAADSVFLLPHAGLEMNGFRVQEPFVRSLLEKAGLEAQVEAAGRYKSAGDMFERDQMSDAEREVVEAILSERYERFVDAVVSSRPVDRDRFVGALDQGVYLASDLQALGLIDDEVYENEVLRRMLARATGEDPRGISSESIDAHRVDVTAYAGDLPDAPGKVEGTIGLVYAQGTITGGPSGFHPVFGQTMGAGSMASMLRDVSRDEDLDAVVLRIDSPGGDALASEEIWAAVELVRERVPVIVSMSDVAASGGYYIAASAEKIVAAPSTITGSIGVVGLLLNAEALWDKLGIRWDTATTNPGADFPTLTRPLTESERATFRSLVEQVYRTFVRKVADGRGMVVPDVDAVAQGRVWTGTQASENGLVDRVGGLKVAIEEAKMAAGIDPEARVRLHIYPRDRTLFEQIREAFRLQVRDGPPRAAGPGEAITRLILNQLGGARASVGAMLREGPGRPLTVVPWVPEIR